MLTNDLEAIVTSGACEIGCYIYANIVIATEKFQIPQLGSLVAYVWIR